MQMSTDFVSAAILVDATPPEPVMLNDRVAVYMSASCTYVSRQACDTRYRV
jgi:hypothetical protein